MDFLAHHLNGTIRYFVGNMQLLVDSDAAYLVVPGAKSWYSGHFYLQLHSHHLNYNNVPSNSAKHTKCRVLKNIVCSAAEAKCRDLFQNAQVDIRIRQTLEALGHCQTAMHFKTDNKTANSCDAKKY